LSPRWQLATRLDLPLVLTDAISRDNPTGDNEFGTGDLLIQGLLIHALDQRWALAGGVQFIFPTASQEQMGAGKYRLVPTGAFRLVLPEVSKGSFFVFLMRYDYDFAGAADRPHRSELQLDPVFNVNLPQQWFVTLFPSSDIRINLLDGGKLFLPFNVMVGKLVTRSIVASVELGVPIVNDYQVYDFKLEARVGFFF
jgi:hypothetical protein